MKGHSVHFTPKPTQPNTILGLHEEKVDISNLGGNSLDKKGGKGDHL
jgi:hypothetical protein